MLGALSFIAVRQQKHYTALLIPFLFTRCDELIDDHLSRIDEVAELSFPQHQRRKICDAVAVFKSKRARFGQRTVVDFIPRAIGKLRKRRPLGAGLSVGESSMAMTESSANRVLTGEPHGDPFSEQRAERERFSHAPIDVRCSFDHLRSSCK